MKKKNFISSVLVYFIALLIPLLLINFFIALYNKGIPLIKIVIQAKSNIKVMPNFSKIKLATKNIPPIIVAGIDSNFSINSCNIKTPIVLINKVN